MDRSQSEQVSSHLIAPLVPLSVWPSLIAPGRRRTDRRCSTPSPWWRIDSREQLSEVAGTVTVIGRERIDRDMVVDLNDLVRYEPGVEVDSGGTRFGFGGFRIRGIGGNRTAVVIDNVPAAGSLQRRQLRRYRPRA
jgi:outer membrane receptor protein involved in Fe transport